MIGDKHQIRHITLSDDPLLPAGKYVFFDLYCTDPDCDCRKTMIHVLHEGNVASVVNYGWESPKFYCDWMGAGPDDEMAIEMSGVSIDFSSPNRVSPEGMLVLMNHLLDENWRHLIKSHYAEVRASLL